MQKPIHIAIVGLGFRAEFVPIYRDHPDVASVSIVDKDDQRLRLPYLPSKILPIAEKRLALADVLLIGGFPAEMTRPLREAMGWGFTSLLSLHSERDLAAGLPSPRLIQAELVEPGHLPPDLSQRLAQVRDLTAPSEPGHDAPPLSAKTGQTLLAAVRELVTHTQAQTVKTGL
jgi:hypothetical protein